MGVPTQTEFDAALAEAHRMREQGHDAHHIAKTLLNLDYRCQLMAKVVDAAQHYIHSGLAPHEHTVLVQAIEKVREAEARAGTDCDLFGLD